MTKHLDPDASSIHQRGFGMGLKTVDVAKIVRSAARKKRLERARSSAQKSDDANQRAKRLKSQAAKEAARQAREEADEAQWEADDTKSWDVWEDAALVESLWKEHITPTIRYIVVGRVARRSQVDELTQKISQDLRTRYYEHPDAIVDILEFCEIVLEDAAGEIRRSLADATMALREALRAGEKRSQRLQLLDAQDEDEWWDLQREIDCDESSLELLRSFRDRVDQVASLETAQLVNAVRELRRAIQVAARQRLTQRTWAYIKRLTRNLCVPLRHRATTEAQYS